MGSWTRATVVTQPGMVSLEVRSWPRVSCQVDPDAWRNLGVLLLLSWDRHRNSHLGIPVGGSPRTRESESLTNSAAGLGVWMGVPYGVVDGANPMGAGSIHQASCRNCDAVRCMKQLCCLPASSPCHGYQTCHVVGYSVIVHVSFELEP